MLAVYVGSIGRLPTNLGTGPLAGQSNQTIARVPSVTFTVVWATCVDVWGDAQGNMPDPDLLTMQAAHHAECGWALMNGVHHAVKREMLFAACREYALGALTPISVQGNAAGWSFDVTATMEGFDPFL